MSFSYLKTVLKRENGDLASESFARQVVSHRLQHFELSRFKDVQSSGHASVTCLDIETEDGRYLLSGSVDGSVSIFDLLSNSSGTPRQISKSVAGIEACHNSSIAGVQWYPGGLFVTGASDGKLKVWSANQLTSPAEQFDLSKRIYAVHLSPVCPSNVAVGTDSNHVRIVDLKSGSSSHELRGHETTVLAVKWSPINQHLLATACLSGQTLLWDVRRAKSHLTSLDFGHVKKRKQRSRYIAHNGAVNGLAFTEDGRHLLTLGRFEGRIRKWDTLDGHNTKTPFEHVVIEHTKANVQFDVSSGGRKDCELIFVPSVANVNVYNTWTGKKSQVLSGHFQGVNCCVYAAREQYVYSGGSDRNILVWDTNKCQTEAYAEHLKVTGQQVDSRHNILQEDVTLDQWSSSDDDDDDDDR